MRQALAVLALVGVTLLTLGLDYGLGQLAFVATWAIAGLGLVVILGQSGQIESVHVMHRGVEAVVGGSFSEFFRQLLGVSRLRAE